MEKALQVLDYLAMHTNATQFCASDKVLNTHSKALYLMEPNAQSRVCGHCFMGRLPQDEQPIKQNGLFPM